MDHQQRNAVVSWVSGYDPFAFMTLNLNKKTPSHIARDQLKRGVSQIFLRADQEFLGTRHVTRQPSYMRFEGLGFFERMEGYPHLHIVLFTPEQGDRSREAERFKFLVQRCSTNGSNLAGDSRREFFEDFDHIKRCIKSNIPNTVEQNFDCDVRQVHEANGLLRYVTKCYNRLSENIIISEFHSTRRLKPTHNNWTNASGTNA